jgi:hypothetical protein
MASNWPYFAISVSSLCTNCVGGHPKRLACVEADLLEHVVGEAREAPHHRIASGLQIEELEPSGSAPAFYRLTLLSKVVYLVYRGR